MAKTNYKRLQCSQNLRLRLLLSTLSSTPILIDDIRSNETIPGLRPYEISLLRLIEKVCDDCHVEINETGTKLKYKPGIVMGGKYLTHNCGLSRSIGYFLEPLLVLGLFGKKPLSIRLKGITNDSKDPSIDTFRSTTLNILKRFGVPSEGLELKIENRGVPPLGGGEVALSVPIVHSSLMAVNWVDEGMVKRIRGVSFSTRVSSQFENTIIHAARGIFNRLIPDVHIFTDHKGGAQAGNSRGFGISLVAETTSGCYLSVDTAVSYPRKEETDEIEDEEKRDLKTPEDVGIEIASALLNEIEQGGSGRLYTSEYRRLIVSEFSYIVINVSNILSSSVFDSGSVNTPQSRIKGLLYLLCALCPQDVSKIRVGKLSPNGIEALRLIKDFLSVKFAIKPDPSTGTVILKCVGYGLKNLSRKLS